MVRLEDMSRNALTGRVEFASHLSGETRFRHKELGLRVIQQPLVGKWMLSGQVRQELRGPEFNRNVLLSLDRSFVQEGGFETPEANGGYCTGKKSDWASHKRHILHLTELSDGSANLYGFWRTISIPRPRITRPNERDKFTGLQSRGLVSYGDSRLRRNKNRELRGNRERRGSGDRFFPEHHPERFTAFGWDSDKN